MLENSGYVVTAICSLVLSGALTTRAEAQRAPDMATLDRGDGITRLGVDFGLSLLDHPPAAYDAALRIEPYAQYVTNSGLGFYGAIPITRSFGEDGAPQPEAATALGNLELGGLYVTSGETTSWVVRCGVALPTASDDRDAVATNFAAAFPRLTDLALIQPNAAYVRLGVSPLLHKNHFFLQADLGIDLGIESGDDGDDVDHLLRLNLGAGYDFGKLALGLELVNLGTFDEVDGNEKFLHTLAVTLRFMGKALQPALSVGAPLDASAGDQVQLFLALGIQAVFH